MVEKFRNELLSGLANILEQEDVGIVDRVLSKLLNEYDIVKKKNELIAYDDSNDKIRKQYIASMRLEGKSEKTLEQYNRAIIKFMDTVGKPFSEVQTNDIRFYLANYQSTRNISKKTLDNERRFLSAFFSWMTIEEIISKNPMLRIKKVKQDKKIKKPFTDIEVEKIRLSCRNKKEKALIEFMLSTGCRVSEISNLNLNDVNFDTGKCVVFGKGNKERTVYLSDKSIFYIKDYILSREDNNISLFENRNGGYLSKASIETIVRNIGKRAGIQNVHPHRFRRTFATNALNRGMPIQHVQKLLGHKNMDTTMIYCQIDEDSIMLEHKRIC